MKGGAVDGGLWSVAVECNVEGRVWIGEYKMHGMESSKPSFSITLLIFQGLEIFINLLGTRP